MTAHEFVHVSGRDIAHRRSSGQGRPVILVHADILATDGTARSGLGASLAGPTADEVEIVRGLDKPLAIIQGAGEQLVNPVYLQKLRAPTLWRGAVDRPGRRTRAPGGDTGRTRSAPGPLHRRTAPAPLPVARSPEAVSASGPENRSSPVAAVATVGGMKRALPCPFRTTTPEYVPAR